MVIFKSILTGALFLSSFTPFDFWPGVFLGSMLLFHQIVDRGFLQRIYISFISALAFFLPLFHWSSTYVGAIPWLILAIGEALIFSVIALFSYKKDVKSLFFFSAFFALIEILRMKVPFGGFGWGRIGHTQTDSLTSMYPLVGVTGITFLVLIASLSIYLMKFRLIVALILLVVIGSNLPSDLNKLGTIRIAAVQGGVDELGLNFNDRAYSVLQRHAKVTENLEQAYDLVVWPENASDLDPMKDMRAREIVQSLLDEKDFPLLVGAVEQSLDGPVNSSLFFDKSGKLISRYVKQDLAPFGEYIPLRTLAEFVTPEAKYVRNFIAGDQWVLHKVNNAKLLSVICFEILDDDHLKNGASSSEIIINQTNNATFGRSNQAAQQLQIARSRAAELGKEILSVSTTGFTAQIDNQGKIVKEIPQFDAGYLDAELQRFEGETWASRLNSWFWAGFLLLLMGISRARYLADN